MNPSLIKATRSSDQVLVALSTTGWFQSQRSKWEELQSWKIQTTTGVLERPMSNAAERDQAFANDE